MYNFCSSAALFDSKVCTLLHSVFAMSKRKATFFGDVGVQKVRALTGKALVLEHPRVVTGKTIVSSLSGTYTELLQQEVRETPADGLCFVHAALQQLQIEDATISWQVAMAVLKSLAAHKDIWNWHLDRAEELHGESVVLSCCLCLVQEHQTSPHT